MFDRNSVNMIYVDVDRLISGNNRTTILMFDIKNGQSKRERIYGGTFENNGKKIAEMLVSFAPVRVIFDVAGLGVGMRDSTLNALSKNPNVGIDKSGFVQVQSEMEICDCGCGAMKRNKRFHGGTTN